MLWVIVGCGYTGARLARRLRAAGADVWATRRAAGDAAVLARDLGVHGLSLDLDRDEDLASLAAQLPERAVMVVLAPPGARTPAGERALVAAARGRLARRVVYVSSTGVYPPGNGELIDEDAPAGPVSEHGHARLAAESAMLEEAARLGVPAVALRASGIYGPGRGVHARLLAGTYRVIGAGDTYVNHIHVDDLVAVIIAAALVPALPRAIYNVADDEPVTPRVYGDAVAEILGVPRPPSVPVSEVSPRVLAMLGANRRMSNARIKSELGVTLMYPTWREGLRQSLDESAQTTGGAATAPPG